MIWAATLLCLQASRLDYHGRVARLSVVLEELSKQTGTSMAASGHVGDEVVLIDVTGVDLPTLRIRIADISDAEWTTSGAKFELRASPAKEKLRADAALADRVARFRAALVKMNEALAKTPKFDAAAATKLLTDLSGNAGTNPEAGPFPMRRPLDAMVGRAPVAREITRILNRLPAELLAEQTNGAWHCWSTKPNRNELPLSISPSEMKTFAEENGWWAEALHGATPQQESQLRDDPLNQPQGPGPVDRIFFRSRCFNRISPVNVELVALNAEGEVVTQGFADFDLKFWDRYHPEGTQLAEASKQPDFPIPSDVLEFQRQIGLDYLSAKLPPQGELRKIFLDPYTHEPLQYGPACLLREAALREHRNVVAVLIDGMIRLPNEILRTGKADPIGYLSAVERTRGLEVRRSEGWITIRPADTIADQANRSALRELLQSMDTRGYATIDDLAKLALNHTRDTFLMFDMFSGLFPRSERLSQFESQNALVAWGHLTSQMRDALLQGKAVRFGDLPLAARDHISKVVIFGPSDGPGGLQLDGDPIDSRIEHLATRIPPEIFANGIPADALVTPTQTVKPSVLAATKSRENIVGWSNAWDPAMIQGLMVPNPKTHDIRLKADDEYWPGAEQTLKLKLTCGHYSYDFVLHEERFDLRKPGVNYETLPAEFRGG
jgi:hypothetical protein